MDFWAWSNPLFRTFLYLSTFGSVGIILFNFHFARYQSLSTSTYCVKLLQKSAVVGIAASVGSLLSIAGSMGGDVSSAFKIEFLKLVFGMKSGWALMLALVGFFILIVFDRNAKQIRLVMCLIGSLMILSSFTIYGHSTTAGFLSQLLLFIHLIAIAYWLGSLLPFRWMCLSNDRENLTLIALKFGRLAITYISTLLITGFGFAYILLGDLSALISTDYGNVLLAKITSVLILLSFGALNKFRFVPSIERGSTAGIRRLRIAINAEIFLAITILVISSVLTTSINLPVVSS